MTGRVQQRGDNMTISVEMVNAADRTQMWGETYNRKVSEMQTLQAEIARTISAKLRNRLTGEQEKQLAKGETTNPQAYEMYLKGTYFGRKGGRANIQNSIEYLEQAVDIDPLYANAHAVLSVAYGNMANYGSVVERNAFRQRRPPAVLKAMELAPDSDQVLNALAVLRQVEFKWAESEAACRRAIQINPNYAAAYGNLAMTASLLKRHDEAIALMSHSIELDPLRADTRVLSTGFLTRAGRYDEAIREASQAIAVAPENASAYGTRSAAYERKKMFAEAVADQQKACDIDKENIGCRIGLAILLVNAGDRALADAIFRENETQLDKVSPTTLAGLYAAFGENQKALDLLENAFADGDQGLRFLAVNFALDPLRTEPRFKELLRKLNLPE